MCLGLALVVLVREEPLFGISTAAGFNYRATNLLVAAWFLVFSLPMFALVKDAPAAGRSIGVGGAIRELGATLRRLREYREAAKFLAARIFV